MTLADSRARVAELEAFDHAPHDDHVWLERLADGCARYTPWVMLDAPDGLVLDVTGCVHLFAGETALAADVVARFARLGVVASHAFAGNPDAARALARYRTDRRDRGRSGAALARGGAGARRRGDAGAPARGVEDGRRCRRAAAVGDRRAVRRRCGNPRAAHDRRGGQPAVPAHRQTAAPRRAPLCRADGAHRIRARGARRVDGRSGRAAGGKPRRRPPLRRALLPHRRAGATPCGRDRRAEPRRRRGAAAVPRTDRRARRPDRSGVRVRPDPARHSQSPNGSTRRN